jgi:hypothetical protein
MMLKLEKHVQNQEYGDAIAWLYHSAVRYEDKNVEPQYLAYSRTEVRKNLYIPWHCLF